MVTPIKIILGLVAISIPAVLALVTGGNRIVVIVSCALVAGIGAPLLRGEVKLHRVERRARQPHLTGFPH